VVAGLPSDAGCDTLRGFANSVKLHLALACLPTLSSNYLAGLAPHFTPWLMDRDAACQKLIQRDLFKCCSTRCGRKRSYQKCWISSATM